ncbi:DNA gyrase inhibitor YacG [Defluviimonas aestuarii]|uniref:DNA gyrase inhibitor YacG n=1 Tax=Albidovulum aestuarii TaxID=1130726 RepID=UPI00249AEBC7|nr:DNA gyrase inhibitor YacG [Defluviimonas aestuarii]MDI3337058.1 DNA gyrase inhibitor YacG [Defluviimonas aestuarii]
MTCPICQKETDANYRPFCSKRCADVDLGRWLNGSYAIPAAEEDLPEEADIGYPPQRPN